MSKCGPASLLIIIGPFSFDQKIYLNVLHESKDNKYNISIKNNTKGGSLPHYVLNAQIYLNQPKINEMTPTKTYFSLISVHCKIL